VDEQLRHEVNLLHANLCQALADPTRILILYALAESPRRVSGLAELLDAPQSTVSRHLKVLGDSSRRRATAPASCMHWPIPA
jgi:DNA-binding transcriptional ArsR family regulator